MTIHELEARTGLERATIRFYEKEGLIAPKRLANGYRDYSEEDALTLEKIALLRRLDLPLEDIRRVQSGEIPLGVALEKQDEDLRSRQRDTEQALQISRAIRTEGASYQTLQPEKYKAQLPPPRRPALPQEPKHYATCHPWRRFFARQADTLLFALPGLQVLNLINILSPLLVWLLTILALWLSVSALEGLCLSLFGTTPGKWLMGLRLRYRYYDRVEKPAFRDAALRAAHVWFRGCGLGLFPELCGIFSYLRANRGEEQPWDYDWEYTADEYVSEVRVAALLAITAALAVGCGRMMEWQEQRLELRRENQKQKEIAVAQYIRSVNLVFAGHWELSEYRDVAVTSDGGLTGREDLAQYTLTITAEEGVFQSALLTGPDKELTSALANGLFLGILEAYDPGFGLKNTARAYSNGHYSRVGDWCVEYTVQNGTATVVVEKTDEPIGYYSAEP